jgi:hypothetical protein
MFCSFLAFIIIIVAILYYHEAICTRPVTTKTIKGFNFIYKEHRSAYSKCGEVFEKLEKMLKTNAKNIKSYVVSGKNDF